MSHYREDLSLILANVVSQMTFPMRILDSSVNPDLTINIEVCDLYHAEPGRIITIDSNPYTIVSIDDQTNTMVLSAGVAITVTTFDLYGVYYFDGTPIDVEKQIRDIPNATNKTPMVFLLNPYKERVFDDPESSVERESTISLFFLTQANFDAWSTGDLMTNAVRPMGRLQQHFIAQAKEDTARFWFDDQTYDVTPRVKFGVYISNKGVQKGFAAMDLSGVQMDITLTLMRGCSLPEECPTDADTQFDDSFDPSFS